MHVLTLDLETYFDRDYNLRRMTTENYIRDPRFKAHMLGVSVDGGSPAVTKDVATFCRKVDWSKVAGLAHHSQFDGLILSHHYGVAPALWLDTLSMARIVLPGEKHSLHMLARRLGFEVVTKDGLAGAMGHAELADDAFYWLADDCKRDVELTWRCAMKLMPFVPRDELRAIDLTIRMFTEPVLELDRDRAARFHGEVVAEKRATLERLGVTKEDLQSSERFAGLLRQLGVEPPMKPSPTGNGEIYAFAKTDESLRELASSPDTRVQALVAARLGSKSTLDETRTENLLGTSSRGPLPVYLKHSGAHTGRWSGGDSLNWQNFPRGGTLRGCVQAPMGRKLVIGDLSQIECRVLNWMAGQHDVLESFRIGSDIYSAVASRFYGAPVDRSDPIRRHLGKTIELGCGFGMGRDRFRDTCRRGPLGGAPIFLTDEESDRAVKLYRDDHKAVTALWRAADTVLWALAGNHQTIWGPVSVRDRAIWLPGGYPLWYRQMTEQDGERYLWNGKAWVKMYGAKLVENVVQALAGRILKEAMLRIAERLRVVLTVHDDIICLADEGDAEALPFVLAELTRAPAWAAGLPLDAEGYEGDRYAKVL